MTAECHSIVARWRNHFSQLLNVYGVHDVRHKEIRTAELLVPESNVVEVELAIEKLKRQKLPGTDQIIAELITAGCRTVRSEIHNLMNSIWNKELPEEWNESIIVPIYKKGDKTDCSDYKDISLLSATCKILSNILLSSLTLCAEEIIGDHQCGFRRNRSTTDRIFFVRHIL